MRFLQGALVGAVAIMSFVFVQQGHPRGFLILAAVALVAGLFSVLDAGDSK
jgi:hypothetical protein